MDNGDGGADSVRNPSMRHSARTGYGANRVFSVDDHTAEGASAATCSGPGFGEGSRSEMLPTALRQEWWTPVAALLAVFWFVVSARFLLEGHGAVGDRLTCSARGYLLSPSS